MATAAPRRHVNPPKLVFLFSRARVCCTPLNRRRAARLALLEGEAAPSAASQSAASGKVLSGRLLRLPHLRGFRGRCELLVEFAVANSGDQGIDQRR